MWTPLLVAFLALLLCVVSSSAGSYQYVRFIRNGHHSRISPSTPKPVRSARSFVFPNAATSSWGSNLQLTFEEERGHITPDFSNGLEYPDPYLLTGRTAKRAASILYRKPLFFGEINHYQSLLYNQQMRVNNGLAGNKLGSLRPDLPFYRFKKHVYTFL